MNTTTASAAADDQGKIIVNSAAQARPRFRHFMILLSFLLLVVAPAAVSIWYLYTQAKDQYGSVVAFSVRSEEFKSPLDFLGGLGRLSGSSSPDSDILYEYILSQEMVEQVDAAIDLRSIYSKVSDDPVFIFDTSGSIEDLMKHWKRMVDISYDGGTRLMEITTKAFTPEDARSIAREILSISTALINRLNDVARADATRYAKEELNKSLARLKDARAALTGYRTSTQIIDPRTNLQGQMGLLSSLEEQLANALIEADLLSQTTTSTDPRRVQASRKIEVIRARIEAERTRLAGENGEAEGTLATLVGEFERLTVEREFAEKSYLAALSVYNSAVADASRQSLYLAAHIEPTLAETAQYPKRGLYSSLIVVFLFFGWSVLMLIFYSLRDRR